MDLDAGRKRLAAAADEDERIAEARGGADISGLGQASAIEVERAAEEVAKFRVMPDPILHEHECPAFA